MDVWKYEVFADTLLQAADLELKNKAKYRPTLNSPEVKDALLKLHEQYVIVPTDKAGNNFAIVCKKFYIEQSLRELGLFLKTKSSNPTYVPVQVDVSSIIERHKSYLVKKLELKEIPESLPFIYWIPKMHKKPFSKQRYIAASYDCSTKPVSALLTKCFKLLEKTHRVVCNNHFKTYGINPMWILNNSSEVHKVIAPFNRQRDAKNLRTYDFSTLYTNIPHKALKKEMAWVITEAFRLSKKKYISIYANDARWTDSPRNGTSFVDQKKLIELTNWLISNSFVTFGNKCFKQVIGIPMGTDCAPT